MNQALRGVSADRCSQKEGNLGEEGTASLSEDTHVDFIAWPRTMISNLWLILGSFCILNTTVGRKVLVFYI